MAFRWVTAGQQKLHARRIVLCHHILPVFTGYCANEPARGAGAEHPADPSPARIGFHEQDPFAVKRRRGGQGSGYRAR